MYMKVKKQMSTKMVGAGLIAAMLAMVGLSSFAVSATGAAAGEAIVTAASAEPGQTDEAVAPRAPRRAQMTPEKRAEMRAQREKFMAERKAAMEAKVLEVVKKYVSDEEKAKALLAELEAVLMPSRRVRAERKPAEKKD